MKALQNFVLFHFHRSCLHFDRRIYSEPRAFQEYRGNCMSNEFVVDDILFRFKPLHSQTTVFFNEMKDDELAVSNSMTLLPLTTNMLLFVELSI